MREFDPVAIHPIMCHQQPARQSRVGLHLGVGERRVGDLGSHGMREERRKVSQGRAFFHLALQNINRKKMPRASSLYERVDGRTVTTERYRQAGHPLTT